MKSILLALFATTTLAFATEIKPVQKSSAIPERREFPVNNEINPCDNFYEYACSKVNSTFQLRPDRSHHTFSFSDSAERLLDKKKTYFKNLSHAKAENERELGLKNYYLSCMNASAKRLDEKNEVQRIKTAMAKIKTREEFLDFIGKSYLTAETSPLDWGSNSNQDIPTKNDLYFLTEFMSLPEKSYYKKPEIVKDLKSLMTHFYKIIGEKNPQQDAENTLKFESALAEVYPEPQEFRQIVNNRNPIERKILIEQYPHLKLELLLKQIPESVVIRHWVPDALKFMDKDFAEEPIENLKKIYMFHALSHVMDDAYPAYFNKSFAFQKKHFGGPDKRPDRQERCTRQVMHTFTKEVDAILLPKVFPNFPTEKFVLLAEKIRSSILSSLEENKWLSKEAKKEAINKIKLAKLQLVKPMNEKEWDFLPQADYSEKSFIANVKTISVLQKNKNLKELKEPSDPGKWEMGPLTVNAYYDASWNKFVMPIGILQYPFYDPQLPDETNLAAVGAVIGHELGHGVDDQGARYDSAGKQRQWMTMGDLKNFSDRTTLLINQFDKIGHNGKLTLGENIGDLVGLTAAYRAASSANPEFLKELQKQKEFYLSFARVWCSVSRPKFDETQLKTDPHSLGFARVNEQMKQQTPFKEAFQCKDSDSMVLPKEKLVRIW